MTNREIAGIQHIFATRLDALDHILDVAVNHFGDLDPLLGERLAPDMFPLGAQVAIACNQPRGFSQWCKGQPVENLSIDVKTIDTARSYIRQTKELVAGITADDSKLDETKRVGLGPGMYCELPARRYVSEYLVPNLYFHITTAYAILRGRGAPLGKADFLTYLAADVRREGDA